MSVPRVKKVNEPAAKRALGVICDAAIQRGDGTYGIRLSAYAEMAQELLVSVVDVGSEFTERTKRNLVFHSILRWSRYKKKTLRACYGITGLFVLYSVGDR